MQIAITCHFGSLGEKRLNVNGSDQIEIAAECEESFVFWRIRIRDYPQTARK